MAGIDLSCSREATSGQILGDVVRRRLFAASAGNLESCDLEVLASGYLRDLAAHEEVEAQDTLAPEDPPKLEDAPQTRRRGPRKRQVCPEALRAALLGRPTERWGPLNSASDLDDEALLGRFVFATYHRKRGFTSRDLDLQAEYTERRGLTYPALTSDRSCYQARGCPDVVAPLLGANRSKIRRAIVGVVLYALGRKKTGVTLSVLEWAGLLFCARSTISEHLAWLEDHGFLTVVSRYVPATHCKMPVEHRHNFYTAGPALLAERELWDQPRKITAAKSAAARRLRVFRRRHKWRIVRGRHTPRPYMSPEEWVAAKAADDASALVAEELARRQRAELAARDEEATLTAAARLASGEQGGAVIRDMLAAHEEIAKQQATLRCSLPRVLLLEHVAACHVLADAAVCDNSNSEIRKPFRPQRGPGPDEEFGDERRAVSTEAPLLPASRVAAPMLLAPTPPAPPRPAVADPNENGSTVPTTSDARPLPLSGAPRAHFGELDGRPPRQGPERQDACNLSQKTGRKLPKPTDRVHGPGRPPDTPLELADLARRAAAGEREARRRGETARKAAARELLRAVATVSPAIQARLSKVPESDDEGPAGVD